MKRLVLAACLSAPGLAFGQTGIEASGSITLTTGNVIVNVEDLQLTPTDTLDLNAFAVFGTISSGPFPARFDFFGTAAQLGSAREAPLMVDPIALGGTPIIITVEEEGVRLPDEQFTLP